MKQPLLWVLIVCLCWTPSTPIAQQTGRIEGIVLDEVTETPIADASIVLSATQQRVSTDQDGAFILEVPSGTYNISVRFPFYLTQTVSGIEVTESQPQQTLRVLLTPQVIKLGPIHLPVRLSESSETGLLEKRRLSFAVEDSISTELMAKLPVSDAGEALKRVTGISIVGGRYVFVRGLGERYSNTLLNSVQIPSPEPNRRVVPMDIFPANLLESLQFVSLTLHLVGALIATAYVVQEKIANEELVQGVLMKSAPKPTLKRRSRPHIAKTSTPRKAIDTPKPQLQQIATTSARLPIGSERFTIPASSLSVGSIGEPSAQLGRGLFAGARQAQVVAITPQFEAPKFMSTSITSKIDTGNSFAQMDFNPEAMEPITTELRDATQSFTEFLQSIREKIKRSQRYPRSVRNLADGSEAQVQFTIRRDGSLIDAKVVASSGSKSLDAAALSAVRDAAPFPSFPEGQEGSTLRLEIPIAFQLKTN